MFQNWCNNVQSDELFIWCVHGLFTLLHLLSKNTNTIFACRHWILLGDRFNFCAFFLPPLKTGNQKQCQGNWSAKSTPLVSYPWGGGHVLQVLQVWQSCCDIPEPQNGHPPITARCSDHEWTSHNKKQKTYKDEYPQKTYHEIFLAPAWPKNFFSNPNCAVFSMPKGTKKRKKERKTNKQKQKRKKKKQIGPRPSQDESPTSGGQSFYGPISSNPCLIVVLMCE